MKPDELAAIRQAIDDTVETYTHSDPSIEQILDLTSSRHLTIAHFLLADAITIDSPTAPTAPTLDDPPTIDDVPAAPTLTSAPTKSTTIALQKWQTQVSKDKYSADLATRKWEAVANNAITEWREKASDQLSKYAQEISQYQAEKSEVQTQQELGRAQAQIYLELAKDTLI